MIQEIKPKLSILLVTYNRAKNLNTTLKRLTKAIEYSGHINDGLVTIVIADNCSTDSTKKIGKKWEKQFSCIRYYRHNKNSGCAEANILNSVPLLNSEYVWLCGDDDFPQLESINSILNAIERTSASFLLLNADLYSLYNNVKSSADFFRIFGEKNIVEYDTGQHLFQDFGLMGVTCGIFRCCFKLQDLDIKFFAKICKISPIYSLSISMLASFYNKKVCFVNKIHTIYRVNYDYSHFFKHPRKEEKLEMFFWNVGLIKSLKFVSEQKNIPFPSIVDLSELNFNPFNFQAVHHRLCYLMLYFLLEQLRIIIKYSPRLFKKRRNALLDFVKTNIFFLESIKEKAPEVSTPLLSIIGQLKTCIVDLPRKDLKHFCTNLINNSLLTKLIDICSNLQSTLVSLPESYSDKTAIPLIIHNGPIKYLNNKAKLQGTAQGNPGDIQITMIIQPCIKWQNLFQILKYLYEYKFGDIHNIEILVTIHYTSQYVNRVCNTFVNKIKNLRICHSSNFTSYLKKNSSFVLEHCRGRYVWFLNEGDIPPVSQFHFLLSTVLNSNEPALIFNHTIVDDSFNFIKFPGSRHAQGMDMTSYRKLDKLIETTSLPTLLQKYGIMIAMSPISVYIIRRDLIGNMTPYWERSRPESHIFTLLELLRDQKVTMVDLPLIIRSNKCADQKFAVEAKGYTDYNIVWVHSLIKHIEYATNVGLLPKDFFFRCREQEYGGEKFFTWHRILQHLCQYILIYLNELQNYKSDKISTNLPAPELFELNYNDTILTNTERYIFQSVFLDYINFCHRDKSNLSLDNNTISHYRKLFLQNLEKIKTLNKNQFRFYSHCKPIFIKRLGIKIKQRLLRNWNSRIWQPIIRRYSSLLKRINSI